MPHNQHGFLKYLSLSKGMFRVFVVLSAVVAVVFGYYQLPNIENAHTKKKGLFSKGYYGIEITAISTGYELLRGGKTYNIKHPPRNIRVSSGWAVYICYSTITNKWPFVHSKDPYGEDTLKKANTNISTKEFMNLRDSEEFQTCLKNQVNSAKKHIIECYIRFILTLIILIIGLHFLLLIMVNIFKWVISGFQ